MNIIDTLNQLIEKKAQIEQYKVDHPEMTEAIQLVEEYTTLFEEVCRQCEKQQTYIPYPVYPYIPYPTYPFQPIITCNSSTRMD